MGDGRAETGADSRGEYLDFHGVPLLKTSADGLDPPLVLKSKYFSPRARRLIALHLHKRIAGRGSEPEDSYEK